MKLGNQVEWALHCMTILAGLPDGTLLSAKVLAEFHGVPKEYLSKSLQLLSNEGLVITHLGPKGGYCLAKPAGQISFLDIIEAVEGKMKTFNCQEIRRNNPCLSKTQKSFSNVCEIATVMHDADESWREVLRQKKLSHIVSQLEKKLDPKIREATATWLDRQSAK